MWLLYHNNEPGFTSHIMKPLDKNNHLHLVSRFKQLSDQSKTTASYANNNLRVMTPLDPPSLSQPIQIQGESFSMVKSTSWLWENRQVYINQWEATPRQSMHLSGKVANLSEMSIASILQFGSGSMLRAENVGRGVCLTHWISCLFFIPIGFTFRPYSLTR